MQVSKNGQIPQNSGWPNVLIPPVHTHTCILYFARVIAHYRVCGTDPSAEAEGTDVRCGVRLTQRCERRRIYTILRELRVIT